MLMSEKCPLLERQQSSTRCIVPTVQKCWGQQAYAVEQRSALAFASLISLERDWGRESPSACAYFKQISRVTQAVLSCLQEWLRKRPNGRSICLLFEYCVIGSHTSRPHLATSHKPGCRTASRVPGLEPLSSSRASIREFRQLRYRTRTGADGLFGGRQLCQAFPACIVPKLNPRRSRAGRCDERLRLLRNGEPLCLVDRCSGLVQAKTALRDQLKSALSVQDFHISLLPGTEQPSGTAIIKLADSDDSSATAQVQALLSDQ